MALFCRGIGLFYWDLGPLCRRGLHVQMVLKESCTGFWLPKGWLMSWVLQHTSLFLRRTPQPKFLHRLPPHVYRSHWKGTCASSTMRPRSRDLGFLLIFVNAPVHSVSYCDSLGTLHGYFLNAHSLECAENFGLILVARGGRGLDPSETGEWWSNQLWFSLSSQPCNVSLGPGVKVRCKQQWSQLATHGVGWWYLPENGTSVMILLSLLCHFKAWIQRKQSRSTHWSTGLCLYLLTFAA